jgi:lambda family phage minor tail protein L
MTIASDIQQLAPGALVDLFELDPAAIGGTVVRFHAGVNALGADVVWQGLTYTRFPIEADGFEWSGTGSLPRPKIRVANVTGLVGALARELQDLVGAKLTRRRTFVKYLDAVNFPGGVNPTADPNCGFPDEIWYVDRKSAENGLYVEWELSAAFDVAGVMLPRRQCIQNVCTWLYRGAECGYAGGAVADRNDAPTTLLAEDDCGKRLGSCKLRFGVYAELPFGAFPGVGLIR